jgi:hypothetical protein
LQVSSDASSKTQDFTLQTLLIFWVSYTMLACWTYG